MYPLKTYLTIREYCLFQLLLYICGSKDKYRQLRDLHTLETHMAQISQLCDKVIMQPDKLQDNAIALLPYDVLISLVSIYGTLWYIYHQGSHLWNILICSYHQCVIFIYDIHLIFLSDQPCYLFYGSLKETQFTIFVRYYLSIVLK